MKKGFSLLEVLIALFIGGILMTQLFEGMRISMAYLKQGNEFSSLDTTASLFLHQFERDLSAAFVPFSLAQTTTPDPLTPKKNGAQKENEKSEEEKKGLQDVMPPKAKEKLLFPSYPVFVGTTQEGIVRKVGEPKRELLSALSFIATTPLLFYGENKPRIVRVGYFLKDATPKNQSGSRVFEILRKETADLANIKFKQPEDTKSKTKKIITYRLAQNVKEFSLTYVLPAKEEEEEKRNYFQWGDSKETKNNLPWYVIGRLELWNSTHTKSFSFKTVVPVFSYPPEPFTPRENAPQEKENSQEQQKLPFKQIGDKDVKDGLPQFEAIFQMLPKT